MKSIDIKGKEYVQVNERIIHFREHHPELRLTTEILSSVNGVCIFKATVWDGEVAVSTGHAYEKEGSTFINKTSYIENCETSAVGRALGNLGIGIDTSIASAEEVGNAIKQQGEPVNKPNPQPPTGFVPPTDDQKTQFAEMLADAGLKPAGGKNLTMADAKKYGLADKSSEEFDVIYKKMNADFAAEKGISGIYTDE